jgi:hypothetical protein
VAFTHKTSEGIPLQTPKGGSNVFGISIILLSFVAAVLAFWPGKANTVLVYGAAFSGLFASALATIQLLGNFKNEAVQNYNSAKEYNALQAEIEEALYAPSKTVSDFMAFSQEWAALISRRLVYRIPLTASAQRRSARAGLAGSSVRRRDGSRVLFVQPRFATSKRPVLLGLFHVAAVTLFGTDAQEARRSGLRFSCIGVQNARRERRTGATTQPVFCGVRLSVVIGAFETGLLH